MKKLPIAMVGLNWGRTLILDQFLGSGSTVIAAEKSNRFCYGLELDPKYCDVIVQRWVDFTEGGEVIKNKKKIKWPKSK